MADTCVGKESPNDLRNLRRWVEDEYTLYCCPESSNMWNGSAPFQ